MKLNEIADEDGVPLYLTIIKNRIDAGKPVKLKTHVAWGDITAADWVWVANNSIITPISDRRPTAKHDKALRVTFKGSLLRDPKVQERMYLLGPHTADKLTLKSVDGEMTIVNKKAVNEARTDLPIEFSQLLKLLEKRIPVYMLRTGEEPWHEYVRIDRFFPPEQGDSHAEFVIKRPIFSGEELKGFRVNDISVPMYVNGSDPPEVKWALKKHGDIWVMSTKTSFQKFGSNLPDLKVTVPLEDD